MTTRRELAACALTRPTAVMLLLFACPAPTQVALFDPATLQRPPNVDPLPPFDQPANSAAIQVITPTRSESELRRHRARAGASAWADGDVLHLVIESNAAEVYVCCAISLPMQRMDDSKLWALGLRVRELDRAVISYHFRQIGTDGREEVSPIEVFRGRDAPETSTAATRLRGEIRRYTIASAALDEARRITVYLPPSARPRASMPVIYAADGQSIDRLALFLEPLIERGSIQPVLLVGADSTARRAEEYLLNERSHIFLAHERFFVEEVADWAERELGAASDADRRAVLGFSNGGAFAIAMGYRHPERFKHVIAFSVGVPFAPPEGELPAFYLLAGTLEDGFYNTTSTLARALQAAGADTVFRERVSGHDDFVWAEELPAAVRWAFGSP